MKPLHLSLCALLVCCLTANASAGLFDGPATTAAPPLFRPLTHVETVFRGQSTGEVPIPPGATGPGTPAIGAPPPASAPMGTYGAPSMPDASTWNAFSPPISPDPFVTGPGYGAAPYAPYAPYGPGAAGYPYGGGMGQPFTTYGTNGMRPYPQGWQPRLDLEWLPTVGVSPAGRGKVEQFGLDLNVANSGPFMPGWVYTWTNQFRLRTWDGPDGVMPGAGLPGKAFRFGVDFEVETPHAGPVSLSLGITPSINTDFSSSVGSEAFQLDGRGMFIFQLDQQWSLVLGAAYWDRVDDMVIPYVGGIFRNDLWEFRIMYPESTISMFLGNGPAGAKWLYARAEYHVEAYEVRTPTGSDEVELEDYRALIGVRTDTGTASWFIEGGWVFDRNIDYAQVTNFGATPNTGFIGRLGWRY